MQEGNPKFKYVSDEIDVITDVKATYESRCRAAKRLADKLVSDDAVRLAFSGLNGVASATEVLKDPNVPDVLQVSICSIFKVSPLGGWLLACLPASPTGMCAHMPALSAQLPRNFLFPRMLSDMYVSCLVILTMLSCSN